MGSAEIVSPADVIGYWCETLDSKDWFRSSPEFDAHIRDRFAATHVALSRAVTAEWHATPEARLAAVIVLDQFPRNMYRASPLAFATDWMALREARLAIDLGADRAVGQDRRHFFYMPFEHAEDLAAQDEAVALFEAFGDETYLDYALRHRDVIREFGRFPHRNDYLGRPSTPAEVAYLAQPGSGF
ncbi:DUF924 domain-containing protein [Rhizobium sp. TRM95111]|uniref:DUF924 family protein n=1 Tax=Rhizobium alarense TaxID=2846851 RepID=UPI001F3D29BA|nr:DUF924 family protein [Rhizobium alarense]MCF3640513.1 DUF924 domain-containing protein [Rhizobium alarense]